MIIDKYKDLKMTKKVEQRVFKGELGYGTKVNALNDMMKSNETFDELNDMFLNEERIDFESDIEFDFDEII